MQRSEVKAFKNKRLEKARKAIVRKMEDNLEPDLRAYITAALEVYSKNRKISAIREKNIEDIQTLINSELEDFEFLAELQKIFFGEDSTYYYGPFGNSSYLSDCVRAAMYLWRAENAPDPEIEEVALNLHSLLESIIKQKGVTKHLASREEKNKIIPSKSKLDNPSYEYTLQDFILFGIREYKDINLTQQNEKINEEINRMIQAIKNCKSDEAIIACINNCKLTSLRNHLRNTIQFVKSLEIEKKQLNIKLNVLFTILKNYISEKKVPEDEQEKKLVFKELADIENIIKLLMKLKKGKGAAEKATSAIQKIVREYDDKKPPEWINALKYFINTDQKTDLASENAEMSTTLMTTLTRIIKKRTWKPEQGQSASKPELSDQSLPPNALLSLEDTQVENLPSPDNDRAFPSEVKIPAPKNAKPNARKVILALHGLDDSSTTWEEYAVDMTKQGFTVISYDHAGHGLDEYRGDGPLNLKLMHFDLYKQLQELELSEDWDEIHIVAHSAGGGLVCQSLRTISEEMTKVKSITLNAPAVAESPTKNIIRAIPTLVSNPGDREESAAYIRGLGNTGLGGPGTKSRRIEFLNFLERGFNSLKALTTNQYVPRSDLSVEVIPGDNDKLISVDNFKKLKSLKSALSNIRFRILKRIGHSLHEPGSSSQKLAVKMALEHIERSTDPKVRAERDKFLNDCLQIAKIIDSGPYKSAYKKILIPSLQKYYQNKELFKEHIIRAFELGNIDFPTLIKLHRLIINPAKDTSIGMEGLDEAMTTFNENFKKSFRKRLGEPTTIAHLKQLKDISKQDARPVIYQSEIAIILQLRDQRSHHTYFRGGVLAKNSQTFFTDPKDGRSVDNPKATDADKLIANLKTKFAG